MPPIRAQTGQATVEVVALLPGLPFETKLDDWLADSPLVEVDLSDPSKT